jgi:DNA-binding transcriptional ArsR family regulator
MQTRRDVFQAIADPTRREIINLVAYQSLNLNAIAENFEVSRPAISQHIKILIECGLIVIRQQGRERYCEAKLDELRDVADWVEKFRRLWAERFDLLDNLLEDLKMEGKKIDKKKKHNKKKKHKK